MTHQESKRPRYAVCAHSGGLFAVIIERTTLLEGISDLQQQAERHGEGCVFLVADDDTTWEWGRVRPGSTEYSARRRPALGLARRAFSAEGRRHA